MTGNVTTLPARGQSIAELHVYFEKALEAFEQAPGGFDVEARKILHQKCALFAMRLTRAPAGSVDEIMMKLDAAEWLEAPPLQTLAAIRDDLFRIKAGTTT